MVWRNWGSAARRRWAAREGSMSEERTAQKAVPEAVWQTWLARWAAETPIQPWVEAAEEANPGELLAVSAACAPLARLLARRPQARDGWVRALRAAIAAAQAQQRPPRARIVAFVEAGGVTAAGLKAAGPGVRDLWVERYLAHNVAARAAAQSLARRLAEQRP
ncbi:MAG: hypothetical protein IT329_19705 [Caldilineaceae bacterium]|nr:hypothetical protein [Caldilineaceae bacterium]